ncbi:excalibur calcium-binding domain-containing protein [Streptomyces sp. NPDC003035]|uniref:excalibur calcium-binding domain-containing protein n=1 Tax=Streptomyces sp. NPDC003035 TaxID=3364676 RepID=UPI00368B69FC
MYPNQPAQPYPNPYGPQAPPPVRRRWWQHPALIIVALVVLPPAGIALAWLGPWSRTQKIVATVVSGIWFLLPFFGDSPAEKKDDAKPKAAASATASASASASASPSPSVDLVMPNVVGKAFSEAEATVEALVDGELRADSAFDDVSLPANHTAWIVCFQGPAAGTRLVAEYADANVHLVAPGTNCPARTGTDLRPEPSKTPTQAPTQSQAPQPKPTPKPQRTTPAPRPTQDDSDDSGGSGSVVSYANCAAVRAAGADPIRRGDPGYGRHLDRDGDGVGCE